MNKIEFVEQLRRNLSSINDYTYVNDTIAYYENYIESHIRMGETEEQVMQKLGDPRLIAKSICASYMTDEEQEDAFYHKSDREYGKKTLQSVLNLNGRLIRMPSWLLKSLGVFIAVIVVALLFTVLKILSPFLIMGFFAYMIYRLITGNKH